MDRAYGTHAITGVLHYHGLKPVVRNVPKDPMSAVGTVHLKNLGYKPITEVR
jgi:hypothetical protein